MDPISLILAALIAGAATGVSKSAANAVQDAYAGFRDALKRRLAGKPAAQQAVDEYPSDPDQWKSNLENYLKIAKVDQDQALLDAASEFLRLADPGGTSNGKYIVNMQGAQGTQLGDHNSQTNTFYNGPSHQSAEDKPQ